MAENGLNIGKNLIVIHRVITRGINVARDTSAAYLKTGFTDPETREGFLKYVQALATILHGHHSSEDTVVFPCIRLRVPGAPYEQLMADHRAMEPHIQAIQQAVQRMNTGSDDGLAEIHAALDGLHALWQPHIGKEEDHFSCQVLAAALSQQDQMDIDKQASEHGQALSNPPYLVLPFVLYNVAGEDREFIAKLFPPEIIQHLIPVAWKDQWSAMQPFLLN